MSMNTALITYGILAAMAIIGSALLLRVVKRTIYIVVLSATAAAALFQLVVYFQLGYLDPFFPVAFVVSWGYSFGVAYVFTWAVRRYTTWRSLGTPPNK